LSLQKSGYKLFRLATTFNLLFYSELRLNIDVALQMKSKKFANKMQKMI